MEKISSKKQKKRYRKVVEWQEFIPNKKGKEWGWVLALAIPIIGTLIVLGYLLFGKERTYFEEVEE